MLEESLHKKRILEESELYDPVFQQEKRSRDEEIKDLYFLSVALKSRSLGLFKL